MSTEPFRCSSKSQRVGSPEIIVKHKPIRLSIRTFNVIHCILHGSLKSDFKHVTYFLNKRKYQAFHVCVWKHQPFHNAFGNILQLRNFIRVKLYNRRHTTCGAQNEFIYFFILQQPNHMYINFN